MGHIASRCDFQLGFGSGAGSVGAAQVNVGHWLLPPILSRLPGPGAVYVLGHRSTGDHRSAGGPVPGVTAGARYQKTPEFQERYDARASIEGTISQGLRVAGLRHARYIGLTKTRLQHALTATAAL